MIDRGLLFKQTLGHFCTDATCAAIVFSVTQGIVSALQFFVLYNFLAFCLQPLAGILLDKAKNLSTKAYIIMSFILLLLGFVPGVNIWGRVIFVGLGNCLFHTGAGTIILTSSRNKMAPLGIFVSSGAVGLLFGTMLAHSFICHWILMLSLVALILLNLDLSVQKTVHVPKSIHVGVVLLLCLCISIRSFMGFIPLTQFEKTPLILFVITLGVFMGKSFGGLLCDRYGIRPVVIISTAFVMVLFLLSLQNPYLWTLVQMIVNLSMPITLYLMYKSMSRYPAFSFGLAASFLVVGLIVSTFFSKLDIPPTCFLILFLVNLSIILYSEKRLS